MYLPQQGLASPYGEGEESLADPFNLEKRRVIWKT
jgi:hypothetical protein